MAKGVRKDESPEQLAARMAKVRAARNLKKALVGAIAVPPSGDLTEAPPPNLFSGDQKYLEVIGKNGSTTDPIPGFKLYWFQDADGSGSKVKLAKLSGYEHVMADEVLLNDTGMGGLDDVGGKVRKIGNIHSGSSGEKPIYMWLMKKPRWIADRHFADEQLILDRQEANFLQGRVSRDQKNSYVPRNVPIQVGSKLYRQSEPDNR